MPKIKTHRGAAKRFKVTKNGKVKMFHAYKSHILNKKSTDRDTRERSQPQKNDALQIRNKGVTAEQ